MHMRFLAASIYNLEQRFNFTALIELSLLPTNSAMIYKLALLTDFPWIESLC